MYRGPFLKVKFGELTSSALFAISTSPFKISSGMSSSGTCSRMSSSKTSSFSLYRNVGLFSCRHQKYSVKPHDAAEGCLRPQSQGVRFEGTGFLKSKMVFPKYGSSKTITHLRIHGFRCPLNKFKKSIWGLGLKGSFSMPLNQARTAILSRPRIAST